MITTEQREEIRRLHPWTIVPWSKNPRPMCSLTAEWTLGAYHPKRKKPPEDPIFKGLKLGSRK